MEVKAEVKESQTLMNALDALSFRLGQLRNLNELTNTLNSKLNRTEGDPICEKEDYKETSIKHNRNIVELFYLVADKMEEQINIIGINTENSIRMID
mgnify:CR=1 FL=1